jgi:hypothetical protein
LAKSVFVSIAEREMDGEKVDEAGLEEHTKGSALTMSRNFITSFVAIESTGRIRNE